ncbi:MAG TPA: prepilin-type N-terminal cleavage/methylation domain-containing protein [Kiritimatiellia bacterium]|jgi:general secretion pathway protein G|nr:prepilin-type N-terminal cleavage/methylation domain-containing protein [Lentisphaerota bacterium]HRV31565.1 prepilin-type N-terminal cleavage/methylation domain-containing protein [Kiritimatiellia bacterium]
MKKKRKAGFTLVEVLTVVVIIALLAALILGLAGNAQKTAARKKAEAEINQLSSFVTDYRAQYGQVPADKAALKKNLSDAKHSLSNMADPWGMEYEYERSSPQTFYLYSKAGNATNRNSWIGNLP